MTPNKTPTLISFGELANRLGLARAQVHSAAVAGFIPYLVTGSGLKFVDVSDVKTLAMLDKAAELMCRPGVNRLSIVNAITLVITTNPELDPNSVVEPQAESEVTDNVNS